MPKLDSKLVFLPFSQVYIISFPSYYTGLQLGTCLTCSRAEASPTQKKFLAQIRAEQTQIGAEVRFSSIFFLLY